jgi:hypothetical protein
VYRPRMALGLVLACAPALVNAQSASITSANATGDCTGTSFMQSADASGKYFSVEWAVAGQFPIAINRGRTRCTARITVSVQPGYRLLPGGGNGLATRLARVQASPLRLNGSTSGVLIESTVSIDNGAPATASQTITGGAMTMATMLLDRPAGSTAIESACSSATKSTFLMTAVIDVAASSNYVVPWPPEPYADRETASMSMHRLFYTVAPCATRTAVPQAESIRP